MLPAGAEARLRESKGMGFRRESERSIRRDHNRDLQLSLKEFAEAACWPSAVEVLPVHGLVAPLYLGARN